LVVDMAVAMIRVIDSLLLDEQTLQNVPEFLEKLGPGLLVTTDAEQRPSFLVEPGSIVRVHRPDGIVIERVVSGVDICSPKVKLFFPNTQRDEIPRLSEIEPA
jgi:hypothetical protein